MFLQWTVLSFIDELVSKEKSLSAAAEDGCTYQNHLLALAFLGVLHVITTTVI